MRRLAPLAFALVLLAAGCGGEQVVLPTAETVIGSLPQATKIPKGDPAAGKKLFASSGCGGCHTYKPAGTNGKVGPDLDKLAADAKKANVPLDQYTFESIKNPSSYIVPGFQNVMPNYGAQLSDKQIADLVAFLTKPS